GFGIDKDDSKMLDWCIKAAEHGSLVAITNLASRFEVQDIPRQRDVVFSWFLKAAEAGIRKARDKVAQCYLSGTGVARDEVMYYFWKFGDRDDAATSDDVMLGETSLHRAARCGNIDAVKYLLRIAKVSV